MLNALVASLLLARSSVDGGLTLAEVADVVAFHGEQLAGCRKTTVPFVVGEDGRVLEAGGTVEGDCFVDRLRSWTFPPRSTPTAVTWAWSGARAKWAVAADGGVPPDAAATLQREHRAEVARCYMVNRLHAENEGRFETELVVGRSGAVVDSTAGESSTRLIGTEVAGCVATAARAWRFPPGRDARRVTLAWIAVRTTEDGARFATESPAEVVTEDDAPATNAPTDFATQSRVLAHCTGLLEGPTQVVSVEWDALDDGGVAAIQAKSVAPPLGACVVTWFASMLPPQHPVGRRVQSWLLSADGGVELRNDSGGLERKVILDVLWARSSEVRFCYQQALVDSPELALKVSVAWVVDPDGTVADAHLQEDQSTPQDKAVAECVLARMKTWRFPKPTNGGRVNVSFPWLFKPAGL